MRGDFASSFARLAKRPWTWFFRRPPPPSPSPASFASNSSLARPTLQISALHTQIRQGTARLLRRSRRVPLCDAVLLPGGAMISCCHRGMGCSLASPTPTDRRDGVERCRRRPRPSRRPPFAAEPQGRPGGEHVAADFAAPLLTVLRRLGGGGGSPPHKPQGGARRRRVRGSPPSRFYGLSCGGGRGGVPPATCEDPPHGGGEHFAAPLGQHEGAVAQPARRMAPPGDTKDGGGAGRGGGGARRPSSADTKTCHTVEHFCPPPPGQHEGAVAQPRTRRQGRADTKDGGEGGGRGARRPSSADTKTRGRRGGELVAMPPPAPLRRGGEGGRLSRRTIARGGGPSRRAGGEASRRGRGRSEEGGKPPSLTRGEVSLCCGLGQGPGFGRSRGCCGRGPGGSLHSRPRSGEASVAVAGAGRGAGEACIAAAGRGRGGKTHVSRVFGGASARDRRAAPPGALPLSLASCGSLSAPGDRSCVSSLRSRRGDGGGDCPCGGRQLLPASLRVRARDKGVVGGSSGSRLTLPRRPVG